MDGKHYCSCFILLFFFSFVPGALTSASLLDGIFVYSISTGRNLLQLQEEKACPVSFKFQNYTIITSRCKPPEYPEKQCCDAFLRFACPFVEILNNSSNNCLKPMFNYINDGGSYPEGLFAMCKGTKEGLIYPALAPLQSTDDTNSSQINCKLSPVLMIATAFKGVLMLVLLF